MEPIVNPKIDKRTKAYKMRQVPGFSNTVLPKDNIGEAVVLEQTTAEQDSLEQPSPKEDVESTTTNGTVDVTTTLPTQEVEVKVDYSKKENNPGFKLCSHCGGDLPPNDDGSVKRHVQAELCYTCIWRNNGTKNPERT